MYKKQGLPDGRGTRTGTPGRARAAAIRVGSAAQAAGLLIPPHAALISKQRAAIESLQGECGLKNTGKPAPPAMPHTG
jgi:hypothetical protein